MTAKFVQHRSPQTHKAKAPYNFVPLPEKVLTIEGDEKKEILEGLNNKYYAERHTGCIELEITTETPLYTRCAYPSSIWSTSAGYVDKDGNLKPEFNDNDKPKVTAVRECQDFFHHGDAKIPVIPGSTLRGMTRALVEILSYSKNKFCLG